MNLAPREKIMVIAGAAFLFIIFVFFGIIGPKLDNLDDLKIKVPKREKEVAESKLLIEDYYRLKQSLDNYKRKISDRGNEPFMQSYLESEAAGLGLNIASMVPKSVDLNDEYREDQVEIKLERITLDSLISFLYTVENSPKMLSIKNIRIKRRYDDHSLSDVTMTISTLIAL